MLILQALLKPTRQYILEHALKLFNEKGFVNVRLQHVADRAFVSVGHLAYHFRNKETIVETLCDELQLVQEGLMNEFRVVPLFEDINRYIRSLYQLQHRYIFFYQDMLELFRAYPPIGEKYQTHLQWRQRQLALMIDFNVARGSFVDIAQAQRISLAQMICALTDTWVYIIQTQRYTPETDKDFIAAIWTLMKPYFTDMGKREFEQLPPHSTDQFPGIP